MSAQPTAELGHGHSIAAWTAVTIMLLGIAGGTLAFWFDQPFWVFVCVGVVVLGLIIGGIMKALGYGVGGKHSRPKAH